VALVVLDVSGMNERERDPEPEPAPIDEATYGGSAAETGGLYQQDGPTTTSPDGDTMSEREETGSNPESHTDG
jgi:hypothetical protein